VKDRSAGEQHTIANFNMHNPTSAGSLIPGHFGFSQPPAPEIGQATMCRTGDGILVDSSSRGKETRNKMKLRVLT
jgi:hypothetical protein